MFTPSTPYIKPLSPGFVLKSVATRDDVDRIGAFNAIIFGADVDAMARSLILHHPHTRPEHWLYVEEKATGQVISSLCLIPWRWRYDGIELRSGEMGICGTREGYRNHGFVRALMVRHQELLAETGCHLSHIQGIPYFYRQFGYEYALPLIGGWEIELRRIADAPLPGITFRPAASEDIPALMRLYADSVRDLDIHADRDADEWRYLLTHTHGTGTAVDVVVMVADDGQIAGYCVIEHGGFSDGLNVSEASRLTHIGAQAMLRHLKTLAIAKGKPFIRLWMAENNPLLRTAVGMGAENRGRYQWQINILNVPRLLMAIAPALERRLAQSMFAGLPKR
ncbi:MAG: GNAT family N-acetyltransferase [Anaerolineae bacterium]